MRLPSYADITIGPVCRRIETIGLKRYFGSSFKTSTRNWTSETYWIGLYPRNQITAIFCRCIAPIRTAALRTFSDSPGHKLKRGHASWREGDCYTGRIERVCELDTPIFLDDLKKHRALRTASFVRRNMPGRALLASEYWPYLHSTICDRNPMNRKILVRYAPGHRFSVLLVWRCLS